MTFVVYIGTIHTYGIQDTSSFAYIQTTHFDLFLKIKINGFYVPKLCETKKKKKKIFLNKENSKKNRLNHQSYRHTYRQFDTFPLKPQLAVRIVSIFI